MAATRQAVEQGPVWYQTQRFVPSLPSNVQWFGRALALSGDFALIGAPNDSDSVTLTRGAVYVFARVGDAWVEQQKLTAPGGSKIDCFGTSVALSGDRALVGQPCHNPNVPGSVYGSAYLFRRIGASYQFEKKLLASGSAADPGGPPNPGDEFGTSVALDADSALVGAPNHALPDAPTGPAPNVTPTAGLIYVFGSSAGWAQQGVLKTGTSNDSIGRALALSNGVLFYGRSHNAGVLWTTKQGSQWPSTAASADCEGNGACGSHVAISDAYSVTSGLSPSAQVTVISNSDHSQRATLADPEPGVGSDFGTSLAISGDTVLVGKDEAGVYAFKRNGTSWSFSQKIVPNDGVLSDYFGSAIAISDTTALIGAFNYVTPTATSGAVYAETFSVPKPDGQPCDANPQCANAHCIEGVCCNDACTNKCQSCLALLNGTAQGTCADVRPNTDPYQACTEQSPSSCGSTGTCDGLGHCAVYPKGTECSGPACFDSNRVLSAAECDGAGKCLFDLTPHACTQGYKCQNDGCATSCASDAACEGALGYACLAGECRLRGGGGGSGGEAGAGPEAPSGGQPSSGGQPNGSGNNGDPGAAAESGAGAHPVGDGGGPNAGAENTPDGGAAGSSADAPSAGPNAASASCGCRLVEQPPAPDAAAWLIGLSCGALFGRRRARAFKARSTSLARSGGSRPRARARRRTRRAPRADRARGACARSGECPAE